MTPVFEQGASTSTRSKSSPPRLPAEVLFERIAQSFRQRSQLGKALGLPVTYYSFPQRLAFIRNTLRYKLPGEDASRLIEMPDCSARSFSDRIETLEPSLEAIAALKRDATRYLGFVEVHIEQGPVLNELDLPLGIVTSINGSKRFQPEGAVHMEISFTVVCVPEGTGGAVSTAYVSAQQDRYVIKRASTSAGLGVGAAMTGMRPVVDIMFGDFVGLIIDTFNDERRGYELFVNPLGVQMDLSLNELTQPEEDTAWDAIWDAAGRIDAEGYVVEMAVPFSSLRFQRTDGEQTWGIGPFRSHKRSLRSQIASTFMAPDNDCFVCQAPKVTGFEGVKPGRNLEIDPTATGQRTDRRIPFPEGDFQNGDEKGELGLTARWGITPNLTLSGAINPDFSQIEAGAVELDVNTQFALFFPEKRPFFLEGSDFFQTPFSAVYTRTVAEPTWGAKLSGKEGKNAVGFFVAQDDRTNLLLPGDQFSRTASLPHLRTTDAAARYRRDLGASSTIGLITTHREGGDYFNTVAGVDGRWQPKPSEIFNLQALGSRTEYPDGLAATYNLPLGRLEGSALLANYAHNSRNWSWNAGWEKVDDAFRADLGFVPKVGYELTNAGIERTWWADRKTWYTSVSFGGARSQTDAESGTVLERTTEAYVRLRGPWQSTYLIDQGWRHRFWNGVTFRERFTYVSADLRPSGSLGLSVSATVGDTIDFDHTRPGDLLRLRPAVSYNFGRHLQASLDHDLQRVKVDGGELLELNVTQLKTVYQFNIRTFLRAIVQYTDLTFDPVLFTAAPVPAEDRHLFSQLLFSYKINPTTVLFLGYSDNQYGGEDADGRILDLTRTDRTLFFDMMPVFFKTKAGVKMKGYRGKPALHDLGGRLGQAALQGSHLPARDRPAAVRAGAVPRGGGLVPALRGHPLGQPAGDGRPEHRPVLRRGRVEPVDGRADHGRLGLEQQVRAVRRHALGRPDRLVRDPGRDDAAVGRDDGRQPVAPGRGRGAGGRSSELAAVQVLPDHARGLPSVLHGRAGGVQPHALRHPRSRERAGGRLPHRVQRDALRRLLPGGIHLDGRPLGARLHVVPRRLEPALAQLRGHGMARRRARPRHAARQGRGVHVRVRLGALDVPALPL